ncbi:hypothetical protein KY363_06470, partial [Candidatus Woesearchaeota archaeon]|nr:hypothetical protein [Candidatus Woesearchaeota archaeon]
PNVCETLYKTHQCLYVDSAAWVMVGNKYSAFMQGLTEWLLTQLIGALLSMGLRAAGCGYPYGICESAAAFSLDDVTCGGSSRANLGNILSNKRICRTSKGAAFAVTNPFLMPQLAAEEAFDAAYLAAFGAEEASTKGVCGANIAPSCALVQGWKATVGCGPLVTTAIWLDVGDWIDWSELDWNMYDAELEGDDFCG